MQPTVAKGKMKQEYRDQKRETVLRTNKQDRKHKMKDVQMNSGTFEHFPNQIS